MENSNKKIGLPFLNGEILPKSHSSRLIAAILTLAILQLSLMGCKKFVDVQIPKTLLYTENTFNSNSSATSAMTSIYSQMVNIGSSVRYSVPLYTGLAGDELTAYSSLQSLNEIYQDNISPTNSLISDVWTAYYSYIYQANSVILGLNNSSSISPAVKKQLLGEAKFVRAYCHYYLTNLFGDVPVVTNTDYKSNSSLPRSAQPDVYRQIISDLYDAQATLNSNFVGSDDTTVTTERVRPTKWAATALLARIYLANQNWTGADSAASAVIGNQTLFDTVSINNVFLKNTKESIWQLQPVSSGFNTPEGYGFILTAAPLTSSIQQATSISNSLLNAFEPQDLRKSSWISSITVLGTTYYFPYKYKIQLSGTMNEYSSVLRISEQYLIRAEARDHESNFSGAQTDLNVVRKRAGLPATTVSDQSGLLDAVLHERQVEFFTEGGFRWFDLKRLNKIDAVMNSYAPSKGASWSGYKQLFPIPQNERNNDHNLAQNQGY
jgi:hypothetical protein